MKQPSPHYTAPWERTFDRIVSPFEEFIHSQTASGLILIGVTLVALLLANSPLLPFYEHLQHTHFSVTLGPWALSKTLHHWVNDGLMALFFFQVGLEIKREILVGELSSMRQAALPILAAIGGMVTPALLYWAVAPEGIAQRGWGVPMATDIAFAVGALVLLGSRVPRSLMMFLVALAIVDDLGAVAVIALFYTDTLVWEALGIAAALIGLLVILNLSGVRTPLPYLLIGGLVWLATLKSGLHATVAGVLVAFTIPARPRYEPYRFSRLMRDLLDRFDRSHRPGGILRNEEQRSLLQTMENGIHQVEAPLQRLEHAFHLPVSVLIIPVFALFNAGIPLEFSSLGETLTHPVTVAIGVGLVLGKFLGIAGTTWLAVKMGVARLPEGADMRHIVGVSLLGGIGFTMSIFIAELAFTGAPEALLQAKTGILAASILAGAGGYAWLRWSGQTAPALSPRVEGSSP